jgi:FAD/FMN-containing dehydrogenase
MSAHPRSESDRTATDLRGIVGDNGLLAPTEVATRSCDPFRHVAPEGSILVRPQSTLEVSQVLALCHSREQRVVSHGGRTGVVGGAYSGRDEIVLSLERMRRIEEIDPVACTATVEAGVTLQALQDAAAAQDLLYPIDLGSKGSATIGGTLATNAGGNRVVRWGMTRQNVLGIEAVLADGTVVSAMNRLVKNNTGYDLKQLFIGSEGTLGIVTRAVLKLVPMPSTQQLVVVSLRDFPSVLALLALARRLPSLSAFELMWQDYYALVANSNSNRRPVEPDHAYYVLVEAMGYDQKIDQLMFDSFLNAAYDAGLIADAVTASSGRQAQDLWRVREGSEIIVREMNPFVSFDISIDVHKAETFVSRVRAALLDTFATVRTVTFGHLGDGNLHLGVHLGPRTLERALEIERCVYGIVKEFSGALTAEHGIGRFKREFLAEHVEPGALAAMSRIRTALDPLRLLNRSVLF